jgi:hypothetical protein
LLVTISPRFGVHTLASQVSVSKPHFTRPVLSGRVASHARHFSIRGLTLALPASSPMVRLTGTMAMTELKLVTGTGARAKVFAPLPSWPASFDPHAWTVPCACWAVPRGAPDVSHATRPAPMQTMCKDSRFPHSSRSLLLSSGGIPICANSSRRVQRYGVWNGLSPHTWVGLFVRGPEFTTDRRVFFGTPAEKRKRSVEASLAPGRWAAMLAA